MGARARHAVTGLLLALAAVTLADGVASSQDTTTTTAPAEATTTTAPAEEDGGEGVEATLFYETGEGDDVEDVPAEGVELEVTTIEGDEVAVGASDADGEVLIPVPAPGEYAVTILEDTLPDGVELRDPDATTREVGVSPGEIQRVLFPLQEEGREATDGGGGGSNRFWQLSFEGLRFGLVIAMMAIGLSLIFGTTGLVNFAHGEMVVFGAIVTWYLNDWGLWLPYAIVIAMSITFMAGMGLDRGLWRPLRNRGTSLIAMLVVTIGLSIFFRYLTLYIFRGSPKAYKDFAVQANPTEFGPITFVAKDLWIIGLSAAVLFGVGYVLQRTRIGRAIRAVADNKDLAESSGIDVDRVILIVWGAGFALATLGGVFQGMSELVDWQFGFRLLLIMFAAVTLGGLGTAYGALVGSLVVGWMVQVSTIWISPELKNVGALAVLILILIFRPQGILGQRERIG